MLVKYKEVKVWKKECPWEVSPSSLFTRLPFVTTSPPSSSSSSPKLFCPWTIDDVSFMFLSERSHSIRHMLAGLLDCGFLSGLGPLETDRILQKERSLLLGFKGEQRRKSLLINDDALGRLPGNEKILLTFSLCPVLVIILWRMLALLVCQFHTLSFLHRGV